MRVIGKTLHLSGEAVKSSTDNGPTLIAAILENNFVSSIIVWMYYTSRIKTNKSHSTEAVIPLLCLFQGEVDENVSEGTLV